MPSAEAESSLRRDTSGDLVTWATHEQISLSLRERFIPGAGIPRRCALPAGMVGIWTAAATGDAAYLHALKWPARELTTPLMGNRVKSAVLLATGQHAQVRQEHDGRPIPASR